jgi:quercetin dioxygenase-like cupin family protein
MAPGLEFRPVFSNRMAVNVVRFEPNTVAPVHAHDEEQISLVVEGELEFELNGELRTLGPNMAVVIPPNVPHGARTYDSRCIVVDAFHPPRKALLEAMQARGSA